MTGTALNRFVAAVRSDWGPISSELVAQCRGHLDTLTAADPGEEWLASLLAERPATRELHREPGQLHAARACRTTGPVSPAARSWPRLVVYAVQSGALEIGSHVRVPDVGGDRLVRRDTIILRPGEARAYLPGDIHDTHCLIGNALVFRFTERDLRREDLVERKLTRFVERDGKWRAPLP